MVMKLTHRQNTPSKADPAKTEPDYSVIIFCYSFSSSSSDLCGISPPLFHSLAMVIYVYTLPGIHCAVISSDKLSAQLFHRYGCLNIYICFGGI